MSQFKYLVTTITDQNLIQEQIKRWSNSGNACYHSVQNILSSRLVWKNVKIVIYTTWFLTECVWEQIAEENILTEEGWSDGRVENTA
jgi:hypothetical protein